MTLNLPHLGYTFIFNFSMVLRWRGRALMEQGAGFMADVTSQPTYWLSEGYEVDTIFLY
jgi:hypothetical protein